MKTQVLVATDRGLWDVLDEPVAVESLAGHDVVALARDGARVWAIVDGRTIWTTDDGRRWEPAAPVEDRPATCLAVAAHGLLVGTEEAHLLRLAGSRLEPVGSFEAVEGRESWYTPWGDPADVRSITVDAADAIYVNVHVGGVVRSTDAGRTWTPTLDIEVDVHQVLAHPARPGMVLAAAAAGFGVSRNGGHAWDFSAEGLHAHYLRAVAVAGETALVTSSTGPSSKRAAVYRRPLDGDAAFERCQVGLPRWFSHNIDTACLAASGTLAVFGTADGRVFRSVDAGATWELAAKGLPEIHGILAV